MLLHASHAQFGKPRTQLAETPRPCIFVRKDDWLLWVSSSLPSVYHPRGRFRDQSSRSPGEYSEPDSERLLSPIAAVQITPNLRKRGAANGQKRPVTKASSPPELPPLAIEDNDILKSRIDTQRWHAGGRGKAAPLMPGVNR